MKFRYFTVLYRLPSGIDVTSIAGSEFVRAIRGGNVVAENEDLITEVDDLVKQLRDLQSKLAALTSQAQHQDPIQAQPQSNVDSSDLVDRNYPLGLNRSKWDLDVFELVKRERARQDAKWGEQNHDDYYWMSILMEEVGECARAAMDDPANLHDELIQVAAVALAHAECLNRRMTKSVIK